MRKTTYIKQLLRTLLVIVAMALSVQTHAQEGNFVIQFTQATQGYRTVESTGNNNRLRLNQYGYNQGANANSSRHWHWVEVGGKTYLQNAQNLYIGFNGTNFIGVTDVANACEMEGYFDSNDRYKLKRKGVNAVMSYDNNRNLIEDSDMEIPKNTIALIQRTGNEGYGGGTTVTPTIETTASNAFYIRFTNRNSVGINDYRVVTDNGVGNQLTMTLRGSNPTTDTDAAKNRLWTWVGRRWLRDLQGNYIVLDGTTFKTTTNRNQATRFRIYTNADARPKLRVVNADGSDSQYIMRAETVNTTGSPVIASTDLTARDDELELADYEPTTGQKYFIRFMVSTFSRAIHEMGMADTDTYNSITPPPLIVSSGTTAKSPCLWTPNLRSMTWTMEQSGNGYRIKSGNGLYMGTPISNNRYSVVSLEANAGSFIVRTRTTDHMMTLTDAANAARAFSCSGNADPKYLYSVSSNAATNLTSNDFFLDFVRNDDPMTQDVPTMQDGKWYKLKFAGVEQTLVKVHVDANGYYLLEHDKGRYVCRKNDGTLGYTTTASQAAQFEIRAERSGWHLECRNGDTPNVKVTMATGDEFYETYHNRSRTNSGNNVRTDFSFEEADVPADVDAARPTMDCDGWYELYFHDVPICARKAVCDGVDGGGNQVYKLKYGSQYLKYDTANSKYVTTTEASEAARFTVTLGLGGWQLTRLTDDNNFYGGYTVATKPVGNNRNITFTETKYPNKPTSWFGAEKIPSHLTEGKKYVFYFDNMLLYGMYDLEMESNEDCNLLGNAANYGGMAWTALEPTSTIEGGDEVFYYRFQNEFGRYISYNTTTKRYQVTSVADNAARFTLVEGDYGYMLKRLDTDNVFRPSGNGFIEKAITSLTDDDKHYAAIYFREVTSNDAWFDDSTEEFEILHKPSFFQDRANEMEPGAFPPEFLQPGIGMTERTLADGTTTISTQNTPEYRLTRYVRKGDFVGLYLTTSKAKADSYHKAYQRLYLYNTDKPLTHQYFMPFNDNDAYVYKNGLVLGNALTNSDGVNLSKTTTAGARNMFIKLSLLGRLPTNEDQVTIACDFCYDKSGDGYKNDLRYANGSATTAAEGGNLTEPTLSLRQIWTLIDAKVMANELVTKTGDNWLEERTIHFSNKTQGLMRTDDNKPLKEYVPLANDLENYWIYKNYTGEESQRTDENLVQVGVGSNNANKYYEIVTEDHGSGIQVDLTLPTLPQATSIGDFVTETEYKRRRQISFSYPNSREVPAGSSIDILVYAVDADGNQNRYNIAKFTLVFDAGTQTLPYMDIVGNEAVYPERSPEALREECGKPHAYLNFDYHHEYGFTSPTRSGMDTIMAALPLDYSTTNYAFARRITNNNWDPRIAAGWGTSGVGRIHKTNVNGSANYVLKSVSDYTGIAYPDDYDRGYLFVDASDLPGQVATVSFAGDFCEGSLLMCTGWIASVDGAWGNHSAGSVILTVMGRKYDDDDNLISEDVVYSFCPGQLPYFARRANGNTIYPTDNKVTVVDKNGNKPGDWIWQQFYFEFYGDGSRDYYLKIDNNATSTEGGDYMLDDIWIFSKLPTIEAGTYLPLCGGEMEVIRLANDYESLVLSRGTAWEWKEGEEEKTSYIGLAYLDWDKFYTEMKAAVERIDGRTYTDEDFDAMLDAGTLNADAYLNDYRTIFDGALMKTVDANNNEIAAYMNFEWSNRFDSEDYHTPYTFTGFYSGNDPAGTVYYAEEEGKKKLIINGKMNINNFEYYHHYKLLVALLDNKLTDQDIGQFCYHFNVLSTCSKSTMLYLLPFIEVDGEVGKQDLNEVTYCENTIQTVSLQLESYYLDTETGELVKDVNGNIFFDWWVGSKDISGSLDNFYSQSNGNGITLQHALKCLRYNYPYATTLDDLEVPVTNSNYEDYTLTQEIVDYLKSLAFPADGSSPLIYLRSRVANLFLDQEHVKLVQEGDDKYAYMCALPIEQDMNTGSQGVVFSCSQPQPLKVKVGEVAPRIDIGFPDKAYPDGLGLLSVRIAKKQFEQVNERNEGYTRLHIPIRNVQAPSQGAEGIKNLGTPEGDIILLTTTDDTEMERFIVGNYNSLNGAVVGTIDYLYGTNGNNEETPEEALVLHFNDNFKVREGYSYTLKFPFTERFNGDPLETRCDGYSAFVIRIVPDYEVWTGGAGNTDWSNDDNWRRADYDELYAANGTTLKDSYLWNGHVKNDGTIDEAASNEDGTPKVNYITAEDRQRRRGYAPLYCTNILMMTDETAPAPVLYDHGDEVVNGVKTGFPALDPQTSSALIRYDFQGHAWPIDEDDEDNNADNPYNPGTNVRQEGDIVTELYTSNVCDGIVFQPETELLHAEWLNYEKAWVEFALAKDIWHLVGSPLKNTISGEWYSPTYSARQETTYFDPITFDNPPVGSIKHYDAQGSLISADTYNLGYDRFAPAVYQRAWDKAKAVLYERGAQWLAADGDQTDTNTGDDGQGQWQGQGAGYTWQEDLNASDYLNRLAYKPMGDSKVNVAIRGAWSGAYNDHTVPYDGGGFSVMPINHFKTPHNDDAIKTVFRLPKEDYYYDIWDWGKGYALERRVRVYIKDENRPWPTDAEWYSKINDNNYVELNNRGRLRSDDLRLDDPTEAEPEPQPKEYSVTLKNEGMGSVGFFLACNPFICGLDMQKFFAKNTKLAPYYLVLKDSEIKTDANLTPSEWKWTDVVINGRNENGNFQGLQVVPARQGFFVRAADGGDLNATTVTFTTDMMVSARTNASSTSTETDPSRQYLTIRAQRDGNVSEARVMVSPDASNTFRPEEDLETFLVSDISSAIPVVYTLTGCLATSINHLNHFRSLPLGIISNSTDPATLTFYGVESVGSDLQLYDAYLQTFTPLVNGSSVRVPGSTQNRFFIVTSDAVETFNESDIQIVKEGGIVYVYSNNGQPLTRVTAYDLGGRILHSSEPAAPTYRFTLPAGINLVKAETELGQQVKKIE
ncbi:MAG: hypothetical protein J5552_03085 [Prevotella sp.]|nr:hypothetical protein [Prevotella sp.]